MFQIELTPEALEDLKEFRKFEQQTVIEAIESQLAEQPVQETRNRKRLRPNQVAGWELRIGDFRAFYDVDEENEIVRIVAVGYKKGGKLFLHGQEFEL